MSIPKIIHQLWKDEKIPSRYATLVKSWKRHHPGWKYKLWTDADIRAFVVTEYPSFLPIYDGYENAICRADAGRYLILRTYGGLYTDLDIECLRPVDDLLAQARFVVGQEPLKHLEIPKVAAHGFNKLLCPSFVASAPRHEFWDHILHYLITTSRENDPLDATGPFLLTRAYNEFPQPSTIKLLPSEVFYPFSKDECWLGQTFDIEYWEQATKAAYGIHYWDGSWFHRPSERLVPFPKSFSVTIEKGTETQESDVIPSGKDRLVSCLMVTSNRFDMALMSIEAFRRQTYPHRELLIVDDSDDPRLADKIAHMGDTRIRFIRPQINRQKLGWLYNFAVDQARGFYVCQWHDDDLYDPQRLQAQIAAIIASKAKACMLSSRLIWMPSSRRLVISHSCPWDGSLLCEKSVLPPYADECIGENTAPVDKLRRQHTIAYLELPRLYVDSFHGRNTWSSDHFEYNWRNGKQRYEGARYDAVLNELNKRLPLFAYEKLMRETPAIFMEKGVSTQTDPNDAHREASIRPLGFNIFGHLMSRIGLGSGARSTVASIACTRLPYVAVDLDILEQHTEHDERLNADIVAPHAINIFHTNPDRLEWAMSHGWAGGFDEQFFKDRYNIGFWAWESPTTLPAEWLPWLNRFDEIWVPSRFVAHCLAPQVPVPVIDIPHAIQTQPPTHTRADLKLPAGPFLFLCMFDELSGFSRKNPLGIIAAFNRAFPTDDGSVGLIVKARTLSPDSFKLLKAAARGRASIQFRIGEVKSDVVSSLIAACDAFVSLHRAEGFGLSIAEAMNMGKPVIVTGYSGNLDFTTPDNSYLVSYRLQCLEADQEAYTAGTEWAEPDIDHAAQTMRTVARDPTAAQAVGRRAAADIFSNLNPNNVARRIEKRLETIVRTGRLNKPDSASAWWAKNDATTLPNSSTVNIGSADAHSILVLTPVKNASRYLPRYFDLLSRLDYDPELISLGFLEGDSDDTTFDDITTRLPELRKSYQRVHLVKRDFGVRLNGARWAPTVQKIRRQTLARARNHLLAKTLSDEDWVLWLDVDLVDYPPDLLHKLLAAGKSIVVPRCELPDGRDYDLNSFRFDVSKGPAEDPNYLIDGLYQPPKGNGRVYLSALVNESLAAIDSVGGTALLIRADLHREGLIFPAYSHRGYIETEGLAMMAKDLGHSCWALPELRIVHAPA